MANDRPLYIGPRIRRLRRELGITQAAMADDLEISPSYVALIERNQRPVTADMLLRLARTYRMDIADIADDGDGDYGARLAAALRDPMFADIDLPALEVADAALSYPHVTEALLRLYTAYRQEQLALADRTADGAGAAGDRADPVGEARRFLAARRNHFGAIDSAAEALAGEARDLGGLEQWLRATHGLGVRRLPSDVLGSTLRRHDRHRGEVQLADTLDGASRNFQLATQIAWLALKREIEAAVAEAQFASTGGAELARRALASYAAAAILMPYTAFARAVERSRYDIEALARQFGTSFEQVAHRLTTLQKPGEERVPFFFLRVDAAGNVSKRLDGAGFPFAAHGGGCPLWNVHGTFARPREIVTQWLELPDGERSFSIARTVTQGGGGWGRPTVTRAIALACAAAHAPRLVYSEGADPRAIEPTPIGVTCRLCHRIACPARSAPPIGRALTSEEHRGTRTPFGLEA